MTPGNVAAYHRLGIAVHADESDKHWVWRRAVAAGADAVLTDVPADVSPALPRLLRRLRLDAGPALRILPRRPVRRAVPSTRSDRD